ncbi:hypothetical protein ElyMa_006895300 [Elysia marginata]|uniref:Secreted protein n=1 Tax=Elysia marginata TaxID=1093978 RepID=A0AAV4JI55_9GAST|nr:hypothetical protein ElyMa_006895300 [Elysia marginata]
MADTVTCWTYLTLTLASKMTDWLLVLEYIALAASVPRRIHGRLAWLGEPIHVTASDPWLLRSPLALPLFQAHPHYPHLTSLGSPDLCWCAMVTVPLDEASIIVPAGDR